MRLLLFMVLAFTCALNSSANGQEGWVLGKFTDKFGDPAKSTPTQWMKSKHNIPTLTTAYGKVCVWVTDSGVLNFQAMRHGADTDVGRGRWVLHTKTTVKGKTFARSYPLYNIFNGDDRLSANNATKAAIAKHMKAGHDLKCVIQQSGEYTLRHQIQFTMLAEGFKNPK